jgi:hypothetical protein
MAGMSLSMLKKLLPIKTQGQLDQVLDGLGVSCDAAREFLHEIEAESMPSTATASTIDLWLQALGVAVPISATLAEKRAAAVVAYTATGGQSIGYIRRIINERFPNVTISETGTYEYTLGGFYQFSRDFLYLLAILQRIAPAHLEAIFNVRPVLDGDVARCGIGSLGRAICGRGTTAYTPTEGTIARCGVGRVGLAITGRIAVIA